MPPIDLHFALDLSVRITAFGQILSALEIFFIREHFKGEGIFGVNTLALFYRRLTLLRAVDYFLTVLLGVQIIAAAGLIVVGSFSIAGRSFLLIAFLSALAIRWRRAIGGDGADQMSAIIFAAALFAVLPWFSNNRLIAAVSFIAAQVSLSYLAAGIAKLISQTWRGGGALPAILSTYNHGHPWAAKFLHKHKYLALFAAWSVITFECLFPLLIFAPDWIAVPTLVCGFVFHAGCAFLMGLNSFLWSFPSTYPCVIAAVAYWKNII